MQCIFCGQSEMRLESRSISYSYKGFELVIPDVCGEYCPECDESIHDENSSRYLSDAMLKFNGEVNGRH